MVEDKSIINLIVKECCRGIEYDEMPKQYSFALMPNCDKRWSSLSSKIKQITRQFIVADFNDVLSQLQNAHSIYNKIHLSKGIHNDMLLPGEVLEIKSDKRVSIFTKMGDCQYLSDSGDCMIFPSNLVFQKGITLQTSEGIDMGNVLEVYLRTPTFMQVVLGEILMPGYYKQKIKFSLWDLYYFAEDARKNPKNCNIILDMAKDFGIGIFPMVNIINSYKN